MSITASGNATHAATCLASEKTRQATEQSALATFVAAGASGTATYIKAVHDAAVVDYRARLASAVTNNVPPNPFLDGLYVVRGTYY
jgi:hypothetical protein